MKRFLLLVMLLCVPATALAEASRNLCVDIGTLINDQTMQSTRTASKNLDNMAGGWGILTLWAQLTDANSTITRFDVTCTVSDDGNTTDYIPQVCDDTSDGICTQTDGGRWQKATPGTKKIPYRLDVEGLPDFECTFAVGAGSGESIDKLTVKGRLCTK